MKNYKIKVNDEAESKEAQELFFALGAHWGQSKTTSFNQDPMSFIYFNGSSIYYGHDDENDEDWFLSSSSGQELTLPQLRDLVVLKRKDINDANFLLRGNHYYKSSRGDWYFYGLNSWQHSTLTDLEGIEPILKEKPETNNEQGLISGADAKLAWANGEDVQCAFKKHKDENTWFLLLGNDPLSTFDRDDILFRLKPRTIKLSLEIPAPFEPKDGDDVWFIDSTTENGYHYDVFGGACKLKWIQFGAWRTEEEIKQVVAALREIKG
ncbi:MULTISPECIES: hypothetical protein [unclassified Acinetobacter]|uniref:hypothetical protein n=1 Tax=unclassified Acinetobacter TaxID=196816 RepID=UPI00124CCAA1|nr:MULTISPECIES: hypothetical protein [unclassified Acinetobacter]